MFKLFVSKYPSFCRGRGSPNRGEARPEHQQESSRGDHKRMQEDRDQSGSTTSRHQKEKEEKILKELVDLDKAIDYYGCNLCNDKAHFGPV